MIHTVIVVLIQFCWWYVFSDAITPALFMSMFYVGREHAQAEQRVISKHYDNKRANAPLWCGLEPRAWTLKSMVDWVAPVVVSALLTLIYTQV